MYCYITDAIIALFGFNFNTPKANFAFGVLFCLCWHAAHKNIPIYWATACLCTSKR